MHTNAFLADGGSAGLGNFDGEADAVFLGYVEIICFNCLLCLLTD